MQLIWQAAISFGVQWPPGKEIPSFAASAVLLTHLSCHVPLWSVIEAGNSLGWELGVQRLLSIPLSNHQKVHISYLTWSLLALISSCVPCPFHSSTVLTARFPKTDLEPGRMRSRRRFLTYTIPPPANRSSLIKVKRSENNIQRCPSFQRWGSPL